VSLCASNISVARLQFVVNGTQLGPVFNASDTLYQWKKFHDYWNSGEANSATITILNQNTNNNGNDFGLDHIVFLPLVSCWTEDSVLVNTLLHGDTTAVACDSAVWHGRVFYESTDTATYHTTNAAGCDSIVTLHLTINYSTHYQIYDTSCNSYIWNNTAYNQSGDYTQNFETPTGCDSIVTLHLTIYHDTTYEWSHTACDAYTWNSHTYNASGNYVQHLETSHGCDSVVVLHLTVHHSSATEFSAVECEHYSWNGITYIGSGDYTQSFTNVDGCDSIVTLHLTINHSTSSTETITACDSAVWHGRVFYESTDTATFHTTNANGCDSIVTLHLTINHPVYTSTTEYVCHPYLWYGQYYNTPGDYTHVQDGDGCGQVDTLHLIFVDTTTTLFSPTYDFCDEEQAILEVSTNLSNILWSTGETSQAITVYESGLYSVTVSQGECEISREYYIQPCEHKILMPSAFTPNGDGLNDYFCIPEGYLEEIEDANFEVLIYSRWGELVYASNNKQFHWNGEIKGRVLHNNTYTYLIKYTSVASGVPDIMIKGSVTVL